MDTLSAGTFGGYHKDLEGVVVSHLEARHAIYRRDIIIGDLVERLLDMGEDVSELLETIVKDTKSEWIKSRYQDHSIYPQVQEAIDAVDASDRLAANEIMDYVLEHGHMPPKEDS